MSRSRDDDGRYTEQTGPGRVLQALRAHPDPVATATELAAALDVSGETARRYLSELHENGEVERKQVGAKAIVWWLPEDTETTEAPAAPLTDIVGLLEDEAAEQAEQRSREWREQFDEEMT